MCPVKGKVAPIEAMKAQREWSCGSTHS